MHLQTEPRKIRLGQASGGRMTAKKRHNIRINKRTFIHARNAGLPKDSWWLRVSPGQMMAAVKDEYPRMCQSKFGRWAVPVTPEEEA